MLISGCGIACGACKEYENEKCIGCSPDIEDTKDCWIYMCLHSKNLENCLNCSDHFGCGKRFQAMANCLIGKRRNL